MNILHSIPDFFAPLAAGLPDDAWWLPPVALLTLGGTAMVDARTGRVPDAPLLFATLLVVGTVGGYSDWPIAAHRLLLGLVAMFALWGVNSLYYALWKRDAFGMGDAKWTLLAVAAFGVYPSVVAWIVGSWLGLSWIAIRWMIWRKPTGKAIHFAPFLFAGLVVGLCLKA